MLLAPCFVFLVLRTGSWGSAEQPRAPSLCWCAQVVQRGAGPRCGCAASGWCLPWGSVLAVGLGAALQVPLSPRTGPCLWHTGRAGLSSFGSPVTRACSLALPGSRSTSIYLAPRPVSGDLLPVGLDASCVPAGTGPQQARRCGGAQRASHRHRAQQVVDEGRPFLWLPGHGTDSTLPTAGLVPLP